jgi:hypothetical protein
MVQYYYDNIRYAKTTSPSDKVHVLRARCIEALPPHGNVKAGGAPAATKVRESQTLVEVETGTRADDLKIL